MSEHWLNCRPYDASDPVMDRFVGGGSEALPWDVGVFRSGYEQRLDGNGWPAPLPIRSDPNVGTFVYTHSVDYVLPQPAPLPPAATGVGQHPGYVPGYTLPGLVGDGLFGGGAIGHRRPTHSRLTSQQAGGFTVWRDEHGRPE